MRQHQYYVKAGGDGVVVKKTCSLPTGMLLRASSRDLYISIYVCINLHTTHIPTIVPTCHINPCRFLYLQNPTELHLNPWKPKPLSRVWVFDRSGTGCSQDTQGLPKPFTKTSYIESNPETAMDHNPMLKSSNIIFPLITPDNNPDGNHNNGHNDIMTAVMTITTQSLPWWPLHQQPQPTTTAMMRTTWTTPVMRTSLQMSTTTTTVWQWWPQQTQTGDNWQP